MRRFLWLLLPAGVLAADLGSKAWILRNLTEGESLPIINGFFNLTLGFNRGAIFGSLTWLPGPFRAVLFAAAGVVAIVLFGRTFLARDTPSGDRLAFGLILGGALGNGVDRLARGAVVDFLDFVFGTWHYWTFNIADSCILVGAILFGLRTLIASKAEAPSEGN